MPIDFHDPRQRRTYSGREADAGRQSGIRIQHAITINRPAQELYDFWRDFSNLPQIMDHLESVEVLDGNRSHWKVKGPAGSTVEWDAEIFNDVENELIAWRGKTNTSEHMPGYNKDRGSYHTLLDEFPSGRIRFHFHISFIHLRLKIEN